MVRETNFSLLRSLTHPCLIIIELLQFDFAYDAYKNYQNAIIV